jgi:hypothetical protein
MSSSGRTCHSLPSSKKSSRTVTPSRASVSPVLKFPSIPTVFPKDSSVPFSKSTLTNSKPAVSATSTKKCLQLISRNTRNGLTNLIPYSFLGVFDTAEALVKLIPTYEVAYGNLPDIGEVSDGSRTVPIDNRESPPDDGILLKIAMIKMKKVPYYQE